MARAYALGTPIRVVLAKAAESAAAPRVYVYDGLYKIVECHKCGSVSLSTPAALYEYRYCLIVELHVHRS